jgi:hypothetical protein
MLERMAMPKVLPDVPKGVKPYLHHGVDLQWASGGSEAIGDCPFCGKEGKFSVQIAEGVWRCFVCNDGADSDRPGGYRGGNAYTFLRMLWDRSFAATNSGYEELAHERKLLYPDTLMHWGLCKSILTNDWLVPGYGVKGGINQLYKYVWNRTSKRMYLVPTPGMDEARELHGMFGYNLYDPTKPNMMIVKGYGMGWLYGKSYGWRNRMGKGTLALRVVNRIASMLMLM